MLRAAANIVIVILVTVAAGTVLSFGARPVAALTFNGTRIVNSTTVLAQADESFRTIALEEGSSVDDASRCYFARPRGSTDVALYMRCGPIVHVGGNPQTPWDTYALVARAATNGTALALAPSAAVARNTAPVTGEVLVRADGAQPGAASVLRVPRLEQAARDAVEVVDASSVRLDAPADGRIRLQNAAFTITGTATPPHVVCRDEVLRPASGHRFYVFQLTGAPPNGVSSYGAELPVLRAVIDGVPRDLGLDTATLRSVLAGNPIVVAVSVRVPASQVDIEFTQHDLCQTFSLLQNARVQTPTILYSRRDSTAPSAALDAVTELRYRLLDPARNAVSDPLGEVPVTGTLTFRAISASLSYFSPTQPAAIASAPDRAFLVVDMSCEDPDLGSDAVPAARMTLTPNGGRAIAARRALAGGEGLCGTLFFEVPASFTAGTITITPGDLSVGEGWLSIAGSQSFGVAFSQH